MTPPPPQAACDLLALVQPDVPFEVRVTPKASRNQVVVEDGQIRVYTTCVPENGKATKEVVKLLAKSLGVAKSRLTLLRGETARDKLFKLVP